MYRDFVFQFDRKNETNFGFNSILQHDASEKKGNVISIPRIDKQKKIQLLGDRKMQKQLSRAYHCYLEYIDVLERYYLRLDGCEMIFVCSYGVSVMKRLIVIVLE